MIGRCVGAGFAVLLTAWAVQAQAGEGPVVVELFTSQGCASCPPADRFAGELASRDDLLVLSFHVNYWDYIGWKDPFATEESTGRQHAYARSLGVNHVYTPQMVIGGRVHEVGSEVPAVIRAIAAIARTAPILAVAIRPGEAGWVTIELPAGAVDGEADVLMIVFDHEVETVVPRGENRGKTLKNYNVVRDFRRIGGWTGKARTLEVELSDSADGCAVLIQAANTGPILGAGVVPIPAGG